MLRLIIEKELREIIGAAKFAVTFGVCALLILLTFYVGAQGFKLSLARHQAAEAENKRQLEGLTDWVQVNSHRVFLPPQPLAALVTGVSNDVGRTIAMQGKGELTANDSRYGDDPIFAVFRFLDLTFVFQVVLSLFAILLAYDAINGEREKGTLRLTFANAVPRTTFILGKVVGAFAALVVPLLIPVLLGCLLFSNMGVNLTSGDWARLGIIILTGFLYFGAFLTLAVLMSTVTSKPAHSFLALLIVWILAVLIMPRSSVLLAGRAVEVPTVDELANKKARLRAQLWREDLGSMRGFKGNDSGKPEGLMAEFQSFMQSLSDERTQRMNAFAKQLNEERRNRKIEQERLALTLARFSPATCFSLATANLAGTSIDLKQHYLAEATGYQKTYADFMLEKTGMALDGRHMMFRMQGDEEPEPINPDELPAFAYKPAPLAAGVNAALPDIGLLALFNLIFFAGAFIRFQSFDVR